MSAEAKGIGQECLRKWAGLGTAVCGCTTIHQHCLLEPEGLIKSVQGSEIGQGYLLEYRGLVNSVNRGRGIG